LGQGANPQNSSNPETATGLKTVNGQEHIKVISHLPLPHMQVSQMFIQQRGDKAYLYLHRPLKQAYALVDVTKPDHPVLLSRSALKEGDSSRVEGPATGSVLAMAVPLRMIRRKRSGLPRICQRKRFSSWTCRIRRIRKTCKRLN
jgi:hypothetical protein